ncbi:hypothetical protein WJX72_002190 [[Myrmecia] bisecta]|uniref:RNase III domain-containing protein n=1 Tax=[Myrmecia] bisecta TaxID=41462 RepID=A0AAW1QEF3_9CHLO
MLPPVTGQEAQPDSPSAKLALVKGVLVGREIWDSSSSGSSNGECSASKRNFSTSSISTSNTASSTPSGRTISASTRSDAAPGKKTSAARSFIQAVPHSKLAATMRRFSWGSKKKVAAAGQKLTEPDSKLPARPSKGAQRGASLQAASLPAALLPEEQPSATLQAASLPTNLQPQPELKLKGVKVENPHSPTTNPRRFFRLTDLQATDLWAAATLPRASGGDGSCERLAGLGRAALSYHILKNLSDKYPQESRANLHTKAQRFVRRESLSKLRLVWRFPDELGRNQGRTWSDKEQATVVEALLGAADSFHEQRLTRGIVYNIMSLVRAVEQVQLED